MPDSKLDADKMFFDPDEGRMVTDLDVKVPRLLKKGLQEAAPQLGKKYPDLVRLILKTALAGFVEEGKVDLSFFPTDKK